MTTFPVGFTVVGRLTSSVVYCQITRNTTLAPVGGVRLFTLTVDVWVAAEHVTLSISGVGHWGTAGAGQVADCSLICPSRYVNPLSDEIRAQTLIDTVLPADRSLDGRVADVLICVVLRPPSHWYTYPENDNSDGNDGAVHEAVAAYDDPFAVH